MQPIARSLMIAGVVIFLIGGGMYLAGRIGLPLGRLPGDIRIERGNFTCFVPLATSILLSVLLTLGLNLITRFLNR
ncbi:MAG: DUF2905 domain-containing protein [Anaerolineae bacterium]|nr:DUF2905 domain-containing protein [Anaerolineae bacterium]